jgi:hypothetical protein
MSKPDDVLQKPMLANTYENSFIYVNRPWCLNAAYDFCPLVISIMTIIILICICVILLLCLLNKKTRFMEKFFTKTARNITRSNKNEIAKPIKRMPLLPIPNANIVCPRPVVNTGFQMEDATDLSRFNRFDNANLSFISTDSFRYSSSDGGASLNSTKHERRLKPIYKSAYLNLIHKKTNEKAVVDEYPPDYNTVINKLYCHGSIASSSSAAIISDVEFIV